MEKEIELADEQVLESQIQTDDEGDKPEVKEHDNAVEEKEVKKEPVDHKKLSTRETIREALKEQKEKEAKESKVEKPERKPKASTKEVHRGAEEDRETKPLRDSPKTDKASSDSKPPPGWTKEGKAIWNTLPDEVKQSVLKREKEVSDGFAKYGKDVEEWKEVNAILQPREQELRNLGVSKAQLVGRMLQWVDALSGPDRLNHWLQLGKNYGIDTTQFMKGTQNPQATPDIKATQTPQPNPEILQVRQELNNFKQQLATQQQQEAANFLNKWSADKPHYQQVRSYMLALFNSGALKLESEKDLDEAYNRACYADPEIRSQLEAEKLEAHTKSLQEEAARKEKERIARLQRARAANVSVKSGSPSSHMGPTAKPNTRMSVKESLNAALQELRAQE